MALLLLTMYLLVDRMASQSISSQLAPRAWKLAPAHRDHRSSLGWGDVTPRSAVPSDPTSREYRDSVGMFTTGITVVTATSERFGHGMTANAFASVSLDPLLVLICVVKDAMMHKVLDEAGRFAVSRLAGDQEDLARYFSDSGRPAGMAQFLPVAWHPGPVTGAPCSTAPSPGSNATSRRPTTAATTVFLGRVRWVDKDPSGSDPLLYFGGYRRLESR